MVLHFCIVALSDLLATIGPNTIACHAMLLGI